MQNMLKQGRRKKTRTSELYEIAANSGTCVLCYDLPETCSVSVMTASGQCFVGIDPMQLETEAEERVHLAHELGHCVTGSFYNTYSAADIRKRHEIRADRRAAAWLVPVEELKSAMRSGMTEIWSLAEYFDVTEDFLRNAVENYSVMGLLTV